MHTGTIEPLDGDGRAQGPLVLVYVGDGKTAIGPNPFRVTRRGHAAVSDGELSSEPMYRATINGVSLSCSRKKKPTRRAPSIRCRCRSASPNRTSRSILGSRSTGWLALARVITAEEARARTEKQDAVLIGVRLSGLGQ
jgi:hypothetical protein